MRNYWWQLTLPVLLLIGTGYAESTDTATFLSGCGMVALVFPPVLGVCFLFLEWADL